MTAGLDLFSSSSALRANVEKLHSLSTRTVAVAAAGAAMLALGMAVGCGSGGSSITGGGTNGGNTLATIVVSSALNDQVARFNLSIDSLSLTTKTGVSVPVITAPQQVEFVHLNGGAEPLLTVSVPDGVYTGATMTIGAASFTCAVQQQGSNLIANYSNGVAPTAAVQVQQPLKVLGDTMALSLALQPQSVTLPSDCYDQGFSGDSIAPVFSLNAMTLASQPTNATNGKMTALEGLYLAAGSSPTSFTASAADQAPGYGAQSGSAGTTWRIETNASTVFQGIGNAEGLTPGMPLDMDGLLQADGSVLATRVAVLDANTTTLTVNSGPLIEVTATLPLLYQVNQEAQGSQQYVNGWPVYNVSNTDFAVWGGLSNLASLPFAATFTASNVVPGQLTSITTHVTQIESYPTLAPATVMTLMPQTIDGTVSATGTAGALTTYTVQLAAYDLFPQFAVQGGQASLLTNPQQVVVYADSSTQMLATPSTGGTARFTGVIFNDNGTLRMDATQVLAGVAE